MPRPPASQAAKDQGRRLQQLREALDLSQPAMADIMGCAPNTISGYEVGRTRIDILALQRLVDHTRISADWIVSGILGSLPYDIALRIQAADRAALDVPKAKRGRPRRTDSIPTVAEAPSWPPDPPRRTVHEAGRPYLPPPKIHTT